MAVPNPTLTTLPVKGAVPVKRVTKRRIETRRRLLDAALEAFAEEGFGRCSVEHVCDRAGYTRGAFYSNFDSLDELFLAMWEEAFWALLTDVQAVLANGAAANIGTVRDVIQHVEKAVGVDDRWYRVSAEFTAHALRNPELRRVMAAREDAIVATLIPVMQSLLARVGRRIPDPQALGHALIAVHDGTTVQVLLEPDNPVVKERRIDLFLQVVLANTTELPEG